MTNRDDGQVAARRERSTCSDVFVFVTRQGEANLWLLERSTRKVTGRRRGSLFLKSFAQACGKNMRLGAAFTKKMTSIVLKNNRLRGRK
jgi:hypothetical protein